MLRRLIRILGGAAIGLAITLAALEVALRCLPIQDGIRAAAPDDAWPVHHLDPNAELRWSAGWNMTHRTRSRTNASGYMAPFDYVPDTPIVAVLGDSYVESLMNPYPATLQAQLEKRLGGASAIYNFGIGGSALPDYLGVARLVASRYRVEGAVVLIGEGDFIEGFTRQPGHFAWTPDRAEEAIELEPDEARSPLKKALREFALIRYVRGNLKLDLRALFKSHLRDENIGCEDERLTSTDENLVRAFVGGLPEALGVTPERIVLLFDSGAGRRAMYAAVAQVNPPRQCQTRDDLALALLDAEARAAGLRTVQMNRIFATHFAGTGERVDHSPEDWHWNATGHRLAAEAASRELVLGSRTGPSASLAP